jgi:hypothetical protein
MANILTAFNDHFMEFVNDIQSVFPEDKDILTAKNAFIAIRKINPKILVRSWDMYAVGKYQKEIDNGDISFFLDNDYSDDMKENPHAEKIISSINRLRNPVKAMDDANKVKIMKYIQNLTKLSNMHKTMK